MRAGRIIGLMLEGRFDYIWYAIRIRLLGIDLAAVPVEQLHLPPDRANMHANSGGPFLRDVLKRVSIPAYSRIIDLGSGKGGALFTFAEFPFVEIAGVELSETLVNVAKDNAKRLKLDNIRFFSGDAAAFTDLDRFTHVYMFNPFPAPVMQTVMSNVGESLRRSPRDLTLILKHPADSDGMVDSTLFRRAQKIDLPYSHSFYVYVHEARESAIAASGVELSPVE